MRLGLAGVFVLAALAAAGSAPAARTRIVVRPATVAPGAVIRVTAASSPCLPGDQVTLLSSAFRGHAFGIGAVYGRVRAHGAFALRVRIRSNLKAARYHVGARSGGGNLGVLGYFRVR